MLHNPKQNMENSTQSVEMEIISIDNEIESLEEEIDRLTAKKNRLKIERENLKQCLEEINLEKLKESKDWNSQTSFPWSKDMKQYFREVFHLTEFRPYQVPSINAFLSGHDVMIIMPTGGGKSLCYQLAAITKNQGFTLVVSPLVSLMEDQVMALKKLNVNVGYLSASSDKEEVNRIQDDMLRKNTTLRILYVTPEKLAKSKRFMAKLQKAYTSENFTQLAVDEVHCCSQWGHDFRPDYKYLGVMRSLFPNVPIMGLTATITSSVCDDVKNILNMGQNTPCLKFKASFNRPNLYYEVRLKPETQEDVTSTLYDLLTQEFHRQSGIIYTLSIKDTESLSSDLKSRGIKCGPYHAQLDAEHRSKVHRKWLCGDYQVVIATIAFGMGIDKPNVRFVIHHSLSKSMENFYQESGRAGRDNESAKCIVFYRIADVFRLSTMVFSEKTGLSKLYEMVAYCNSNSSRCRRQIISDHFDEKWENTDCNRMCDNCDSQSNKTKDKETVNVNDWANAAILILNQAKCGDIKVTANKLVDALLCKGQSNLRVSSWSKPSCRGIAKNSERHFVEAIVSNMLIEGYLKEDFHFTPYSTISYILPKNRDPKTIPSTYSIPLPRTLVKPTKLANATDSDNSPPQKSQKMNDS